MTGSILIVEDERAIQELLSFNLGQAGYDTRCVVTTADAWKEIHQAMPDLILLDWMLPQGSGVTLAKQLREDVRTRHVPIIMLTARSEEADKVHGLEAGADDYITKPFSPRELLARIKAALRRQSVSEDARDELISTGSLSISLQANRVIADGVDIELGPTEFRLLHFLMTHAERVYSRDQLLDQVWGTQKFVEERTVDVHIRRLRAALEPSGHDQLIQTVRGRGYIFSERG